MSQSNEFSESKAICNEIGSAVLEALAQNRDFSVRSLINILEQAELEKYHDHAERQSAINQAIKILKKFT